MEDLPQFLASSVSTSQGSKKTMDTLTEAVIERDIMKKGKEGDTTGFFAIHAGFAGKDGAVFVHDHLRHKLIHEMGYEKDIKDALVQAMKDTQHDLYKHWKDTGTLQGCQSCVVVVRDSVVHCANAGHCAALLCRAEGEHVVLSADHTEKRFDEAEKFPLKSLALDFEDEFILMASSTFWEKFSHDQGVKMARTALHKYRDVTFAAQKLTYAANVNGVAGNVAISIILLNAQAACGGEHKHGLFSKPSGDQDTYSDMSHGSHGSKGTHGTGASGHSGLGGLLGAKHAPQVLAPKHNH